ncbi:MAG: ASCH domain-containing protein [Desulfovibrionaceae bacterium]
MKVLSVWQPWAFLIATGLKDCENRSWPTKHRGLLLIHASKAQPFDELEATRIALEAGVELAALRKALENTDAMRTGGIVGMVDLAGCVKDHGSPWAVREAWQWVWDYSAPLPFTPLRGRQGLFKHIPVDLPLKAALNRQQVLMER